MLGSSDVILEASVQSNSVNYTYIVIRIMIVKYLSVYNTQLSTIF